jgi:hypothetical protein
MKSPSLTAIELKEIIESHGGVIKNITYTENGYPQQVIIHCGNKFDYYPHEVHPDYGIKVTLFKYRYKTQNSLACPYCARPLLVKSENDRQRLWIAMNRQVNSLGGVIVSPNSYIDVKTKYYIQHDDKGFYTTPRQLLGLKTYKPEHGRRISASSGKRLFINYNDLQEICSKKQIKLITTEQEFLTMLDYEKRSIKRDATDGSIALTPKQIPLKVIYKNLPFNITVNDLMRPEYLPYPRRQLSEELCRSVFEYMFKSKFTKVRPVWLRNNETGRNLELDGFAVIESHKIAFEHDGFYHNNDRTKILDFLKDRMCETAGVKLFRIPELFTKTEFWELPKLILDIAKQKGVDDLIKVKSGSNSYLTEIYLSMAKPRDENIKFEIEQLAQKHNFKIILFRSAKTKGDIGRLYVTLQNELGARQRTFRATDVINNLELVLEHLNVTRKRDIIPNQKVKNTITGEVFDSISAAARSIGKPPSYLQTRLKINKKNKRIVTKNNTPFILHIQS